MKRSRIIVIAGAWFFLILLLIPPLWYSLRTPFALIDDYNSWFIVQKFSHFSGILQWLNETWLHPAGRFRITYDMYLLFTWTFLGDNSSLHHAMRWVLKAVVVGVTYKILRVMAPDKSKTVGTAFWVFCVLYIFFPNNPEARLAPQELLTVTFLSLMLYELAHLFTHREGDLARLGLSRYLWFLFVFTAMLWSKEPNIVLGMVTLVVLAAMSQRQRLRLFFLAIILLITGIRVWRENHAGGYGVTSSVTWHLIQYNISWYGRNIFLCRTSFLCALLLIIPFLAGIGLLAYRTRSTRQVKNRGVRGISLWLKTYPFLTFSWMILLDFIAFLGIIFISWDIVLRYFYPLVYLLALGISMLFLEAEGILFRRKRAVIIFVMIASVYYIGSNYYNVVYQFACQYYTREVEKDLLGTIDQLLKDGKSVSLTEESEYEYKIINYFNDYLPFYKNTGYRITIGPPITEHGRVCYYVLRNKSPLPEGYQLYRCFNDQHVSKVLTWSDRISSWFHFGRRAFHQEDAGTEPIGRHGEEIHPWYIYHCPIFNKCP